MRKKVEGAGRALAVAAAAVKRTVVAVSAVGILTSASMAGNLPPLCKKLAQNLGARFDSCVVSKHDVVIGKERLKVVRATWQGRVFVMTVTRDAGTMIVGPVISFTEGKRPVNLVARVAQLDHLVQPPMPRGAKVDVAKVKQFSYRVGTHGGEPVYVILDPLCSWCHKTLQELEPLVMSGKLDVALRFAIVHGKEAEDAAVQALCVYHKKGAKAFYEYVLHSRDRKRVVEANCTQKELSQYRNEVRKSSEQAFGVLGVRGTPTLVIHGKMYTGYMSAHRIMQLESGNGSAGAERR